MRFQEKILLSEEIHDTFRLKDARGRVYSFDMFDWKYEFLGDNISFLPHNNVIMNDKFYKIENGTLLRIWNLNYITESQHFTELEGTKDFLFYQEKKDKKITTFRIFSLQNATLTLIDTINVKASCKMISDVFDSKTLLFIATEKKKKYIKTYKLQGTNVEISQYDSKSVEHIITSNLDNLILYKESLYFLNSNKISVATLDDQQISTVFEAPRDSSIITYKLNKNRDIITQIKKDNDSSLWIIENDNKDPIKFEIPKTNKALTFNWIYDNIFWIREQPGGNIWLATKNSLGIVPIGSTFFEHDNTSNDYYMEYKEFFRQSKHYQALEKYEEALECAYKAFVAAAKYSVKDRSTSSNYCLFQCESLSADLYHILGEKKNALSSAKRALKEITKIMSLEESRIYRGDAIKCYLRLWRIDKKIRYINTGLEMSQELYEQFPSSEQSFDLYYDALTEYALKYAEENNFKKALPYFEKVVEICEYAVKEYQMSLLILFEIVSAYYHYGIGLNFYNEKEKAKHIFSRLIEIRESYPSIEDDAINSWYQGAKDFLAGLIGEEDAN